jgi:hypothetical protein
LSVSLLSLESDDHAVSPGQQRREY